MTETFFIKKGDTSPALLADLLPAGTDITGATAVVFSMRPRGSTTPTVNRAAATIVTPTNPARLRYNWTSLNTAAAGNFEGEFEVTRADGSIETFPNDGHIPISITGDIA